MKIPQSTNPELRKSITSQTQQKVRTSSLAPSLEVLNDGEIVIVGDELYIRSGTVLKKYLSTDKFSTLTDASGSLGDVTSKVNELITILRG